MSERRYISLDVGSVSIKAVVFDESGRILAADHARIEGSLPERLGEVLTNLNHRFIGDDCFITAITGSESGGFARLLGMEPVNELAAAFRGATDFVPRAGSILSVGGFHAVFVRLEDDRATGCRVIKDSIRNSRCSSGCGIFIEQEARRFSLSLEELVDRALQSPNPPAISGRCTVFAKTDIIHRHQNGVSLTDTAGSICRMVARNIAGELICKTAFETPVVFIGGVAQNKAVHDMLAHILGLDNDGLIVPPDALFGSAIGAYRHSLSNGKTSAYRLEDAVQKTCELSSITRHTIRRIEPLKNKHEVGILPANILRPYEIPDDYILGIDIGSTNTKVVCVARSGALLERCSIPTRGQPLEAVREAFDRMIITKNGSLPRAVGVTGSGRRYVGEIIRADIVVNEITAHAEAGISFDSEVDTIIDIGGQDSKFIEIKNGCVTAFEMNKVCSAGTGSFLEETAGLLGLDVRTSFIEKAFESAAPLDLGDRCTVFMSAELAQRRNQGLPPSDIAAGLAYAVVNNYLSRVVGRHKIGRNVSFQGGVAGNGAVVAALEQILHQSVFVHPHYELAGAIGAAIIAGKESTKPSRFIGYSTMRTIALKHASFFCGRCGNDCSVNYVETDDKRRLCFGGVCGQYDEKKLAAGHRDSSPVGIRQRLLEHYLQKCDTEIDERTIGLPRAMHFTELLPFWTAFLQELGANFVVSPPTTREMMQSGNDISPSGSCLPLKIAYGHCLHLRRLGVRRLLVPSLSNVAFNTQVERLNHICPAAQAWPYTTASMVRDDIEILAPTVRMAIPHLFKSDMIRLGVSLGYGKHKIRSALAVALAVQNNLYRDLRTAGNDIAQATDGVRTVIFARPYTFSDYQISSRLQPILDSLGVTAIPFDMLPAPLLHSGDVNGMYWYFGKRFLQAAQAMKSLENPVAIFLSAYGCGPDTLLIHMLRDALGDTPSLELEIDQHCDFTGLRTRLEAFFYSLRKNRQFNLSPNRRRMDSPSDIRGRRILIPRMSDHAVVCASALKSLGYRADVMPLTGSRAMSRGKSVVNGGECLPSSMLAGDMLDYLENHNGHEPTAIFMISGDGPCRLGQYTYLLRKTLDESGHNHIPIVDMSQDTSFYTKLDIVSSEFKRRLWKGSVAIDLVHARYRQLRPLMDEKERLDDIYQTAVSALSDSVDDDKKLSRRLKSTFSEFDKIETIHRRPEATIAIVGENYVRSNVAANQQLVEKLEDMNAAVYLPHLTEWIYYTNWTARLHCLYEKRYIRYYRMHLMSLIQKIYSYRLHRTVRNSLPALKEPGVKRIFALASPYVPRTFEGETIISIGRTIDYFLQGVDGVIQVSPFGCMAGTIYETISRRLSDDLDGFPILNLQFDGRDEEIRREELESFLIMAKNWKKQREVAR